MKVGDRTEICAGEEVTFTVRVRLIGGTDGFQLREISVDDDNLPGLLVPGDANFVASSDQNGNGYVDFIDNNNDGISDEEFVWNYTVVYNATTTSTATEEAELWFVDPSTSAATYQADVTDFDQTTVTVNQGLCASIGDLVWNDFDADGVQDSGEAGIAGATVNLLDGSGNFLQTTTTNAAGVYQFSALPPNDYIVEFETPLGFNPSPVNAGGNDFTDSDASVSTGRTSVITLAASDVIDDVDAGFHNSADLSLIVTVDNEVANVGDTRNFTITVFNDGPDNATGVGDRNYVPSGFADVSVQSRF